MKFARISHFIMAMALVLWLFPNLGVMSTVFPSHMTSSATVMDGKDCANMPMSKDASVPTSKQDCKQACACALPVYFAVLTPVSWEMERLGLPLFGAAPQHSSGVEPPPPRMLG